MTLLEALDRMLRLARELVSAEVADDLLVKRFRRFKITCLADKANLESHAGQTALVAFVSLVARMGVRVFLDLPEVELAFPQPPLRGTSLREGLVSLGHDLIPGSTITVGTIAEPDLIFILGDTAYPPSGITSWRLTGSAWEGHIQRSRLASWRWQGSWPIGAMASAALAAPEVFKAVLRGFHLRSDHDRWLLRAVQQAKWDFGDGCPTPPELHTGRLDIISCGAIGQALLFSLLRIPYVQGSARVFDRDVADGTNLNRGMLTRRSDIGRKKVEIVSAYSTPGFSVDAVPEHFGGESGARLPCLGPRVLVGVDDIPSRWTIQRATEGWLGVGGTSHFQVSTSSHAPGEPCAGCLHPVDDPDVGIPIPTVSFVSFWAGLALAARLLRYQMGRPYPKNQQHLWLAPMRMDAQHAALWYPVAARPDCPVGCEVSRAARKVA